MLLTSAVWLLAASLIDLAVAAPKPQTFNDASSTLSSLLSLTATATSSATSSSTPVASNDACAQLAARARASGVTYPIVPAEAAWQCLQAVPFDASTAEPWLRSLQPYFRWQTTLSYNKNPPSSYQLPAYDFQAAYDEILSNVQNRRYSNQYAFEFAIYRLVQRVHDGHFAYLPNLVHRPVSFGRPFALVSVSSNGQDLPKPYVYSDVLLSYNRTSFSPSAVTKINGQDATTYLTDFSGYSSFQDPDALYNSLFLELPSLKLGSAGAGPGIISGGGRGDLVYPNATTVLTFENGTTRTYQNIARLTVPFANITSAQNLYNLYINPRAVPTSLIGGVQFDSTLARGYPPAVLRSSNYYTAGYYLNNSGYTDVAVLSLPTFQAGTNVIATTLAFLDRAKAAGKTKLIIDLTANGGGSVAYGYALFEKLFPNLVPYLGTRFRATEVFDVMGQVVSDFSNGSAEYNRYPYEALFGGATPFPYAADLDMNYRKFPNWPSKFGPRTFNGDNFSSIIQWNLSESALNVPLRLITNSTQPLFQPQDIILLTDGYCASTCSNFVYLMTSQAGVRTVSVGGRPNSGAMQVVGGTRGPNNYAWSILFSYVNLTYSLAVQSKGLATALNLYNNTQLGEYLGSQGTNPLLPFLRGGTTSSLNVRDNIRRNDTNQIPLQFQYQASDCRIFWTADMTVDITALWKEVYDVTWADGQCVAGGFNTSSSKVKRSAEERIKTRALQRRALSPSYLATLAAGEHIFTNHHVDMNGGGVMIP